MFFQGTAGIDVVVRAKKEPQPDTNDKMLQSLDQHWITIMNQHNKKKIIINFTKIITLSKISRENQSNLF